MSAYAALLARLYEARRAGVVLGLDRVRAVLDRLGGPDRRLGRVVHIAGTNGKGSTARLVEALARASGRRVALYTSPHLQTLRERIVVDDALVAEDAIVDAASAVTAAGGDALTFFEQVTAIAMVCFARAAPEVTVLEVGLGGRLDATNVVAADVGVVTGVALDHQAILGDTLAQIAVEKAGIWKPGQAAVIGAAGEPEVVPQLVGLARRAGVRSIELIEAAAIASVPPLRMLGAHQRGNAAAAVAAARAAGCLPADGGREALAMAQHPGRLEVVGASPVVVLDGAHNPAGARALATAMATLPRPRVLVVAVSEDKDVGGIVAPLAVAADVVIATRYDQVRALAPTALAAHVPGAVVVDDAAAAVAKARGFAGTGGSVVVTGSLFLVGQVRHHLLGGPVDPMVVTDPAPRP